MTVVHDFAKSLKRSRGYRDAPWWEQVYREAFPHFQTMSYVDDGQWGQHAGIDRLVNLSDGKVVTVDEKVREENWPDFALERWSNRERNTPGWIQKHMAADYIAYAFAPSRTCYLLPTLQLQRAWRLNCRQWVSNAEHYVHGYRVVEARNRVGGGYYTTESIAVPIAVVLTAIRDALVVRWDESE